MDETGFNAAAQKAFQRLMAAADALDPDVIDSDSTGDMVTLTAANGEKCIINTQRATRQLWVAGKGQGIHFSLAPDGRWMDDKGKGLELFAFVDDVVQAMRGAAPSL